jgi:N-acetyl-1-D-myo-inositol-2-amino-2-deoxy-alpha-D-glucopyranoside deacetylase
MPEVSERVLFVHAHPDDETISTGGTIALLVKRGAQVTVVTCTRGEQGEVIPAALANLEGDPDALAEHRERELAGALAALGVTDHRYLGSSTARVSGNAIRRYRDSGMQWGDNGAEAAADVDDLALTRADFGEVASDIATVIADVAPDAVISYDSRGGYGHPDHIVAFEASLRAAVIMGVPFFSIEVPAEVDLQPESPPESLQAPGVITIDVREVLAAKRAALQAHETQVVVHEDTFALSNGVVHPIGVTESFRRIHPGGGGDGDDGSGDGGRDDVLTPFRDYSLTSKILTAAATLLGGAFAGFIFTAVHQGTFLVGSFPVPLGLILGLGGTAALLAGLRIRFDSRVLAGIGSFAVLGATAILSAPTPGGSLVVPANVAGYVWTFGSALIAFVVLAWPRVHQRASGKINSIPAVKGSSIP